MSRQYSNRPFVPPRRQVPLQMCEFVSYPAAQPNDPSTDSSSWRLTDPLPYIHQPSALPPSPPMSAQNDFSYFQYPPYRPALESPLLASNSETSNPHHRNERCHLHYRAPNDAEPTRPLLPFSRVTVIVLLRSASPSHLAFCSLGGSHSNCIGSTSSALSFGKSIGSVLHSASTLVRR